MFGTLPLGGLGFNVLCAMLLALLRIVIARIFLMKKERGEEDLMRKLIPSLRSLCAMLGASSLEISSACSSNTSHGSCFTTLSGFGKLGFEIDAE